MNKNSCALEWNTLYIQRAIFNSLAYQSYFVRLLLQKNEERKISPIRMYHGAPIPWSLSSMESSRLDPSANHSSYVPYEDLVLKLQRKVMYKYICQTFSTIRGRIGVTMLANHHNLVHGSWHWMCAHVFKGYQELHIHKYVEYRQTHIGRTEAIWMLLLGMCRIVHMSSFLSQEEF